MEDDNLKTAIPPGRRPVSDSFTFTQKVLFKDATKRNSKVVNLLAKLNNQSLVKFKFVSTCCCVSITSTTHNTKWWVKIYQIC